MSCHGVLVSTQFLDYEMSSLPFDASCIIIALPVTLCVVSTFETHCLSFFVINFTFMRLLSLPLPLLYGAFCIQYLL